MTLRKPCPLVFICLIRQVSVFIPLETSQPPPTLWSTLAHPCPFTPTVIPLLRTTSFRSESSPQILIITHLSFDYVGTPFLLYSQETSLCSVKRR